MQLQCSKPCKGPLSQWWSERAGVRTAEISTLLRYFNKWWKMIFCHLLKYLSKMDLSAVLTLALSDYHWLRRPLHGLLHCSCLAVIYPTLDMICDFWPSKFSHYPKFLSLPDPILTWSQKPLPIRLCTWVALSWPALAWVESGRKKVVCLGLDQESVGHIKGHQWLWAMETITVLVCDINRYLEICRYLEGGAIEAVTSIRSFHLQSPACIQPHAEGFQLCSLCLFLTLPMPPPPPASCPATPLRGPRTPRGPAPVKPVRQPGEDNQVRVERILPRLSFPDDPRFWELKFSFKSSPPSFKDIFSTLW